MFEPQVRKYFDVKYQSSEERKSEISKCEHIAFGCNIKHEINTLIIDQGKTS